MVHGSQGGGEEADFFMAGTVSQRVSTHAAINRSYITHLPLELALLDCVKKK
jgi:hypothetical protein